jgi:hypothetical protein
MTKTKATLVLLAGAFLAAALMVAVSWPAFGTQNEDYYEDDYQEECTSYRQHSGNIPGYYDYAVFFEQGFEPVKVETNGEAIYLAPPDGIAWDRVYKCHEDDETTTTTTVMETTTTSGEPTTTTTSTSSTQPSTTPTTTGSSPTTTTVNPPVTVPPAPSDPELPYTGAGAITGLVLLGSALTAGGWRLIRRQP